MDRGDFGHQCRISMTGQALCDAAFALPAIERFAMMGQHLFGSAGPCIGGFVNFGRIDIIADAVDHEIELLHLRMSVNNFANDLQLRF